MFIMRADSLILQVYRVATEMATISAVLNELTSSAIHQPILGHLSQM